VDLGLGLGSGLCVGTGNVAGTSVGTTAGGGIVEVAFGVALLVFFVLRAGDLVTSAGDGPTSAGFATSVPAAAGVTG